MRKVVQNEASEWDPFGSGDEFVHKKLLVTIISCTIACQPSSQFSWNVMMESNSRWANGATPREQLCAGGPR